MSELETCADAPDLITPFERAAEELIKSGMAVLPCGEDKKPLTRHGLKDATKSMDVVRGWAKTWPDARVAIACQTSGLVVIDIDDFDAWDQYCKETGHRVEPTRRVRTPSGGEHLYFAAKEGVNYVGKLCEGVDVKHKGYVLAPPSEAYSKRADKTGPYVWLDKISDLAPAPAWLEKPVEAPVTAGLGTASSRTLRLGTAPTDTPTSLAEVEELLAFVSADLPYPKWVNVLMAVHNCSAGSAEGCDLAETWSSKGTKFVPGEVQKKWLGFEPGKGVTVSYIAHLTRKAGADLSAISRKHKTGTVPAATEDTWSFAELDLSHVVLLPEVIPSAPDPSPSVSDACASTPVKPKPLTVGDLIPPGTADRAAIMARTNALADRAFSAALAEPEVASRYLIKNWMDMRSTCMLFGPSGVGKTFVALSMAHAVAAGTPWNDCKVTQGTVVYLTAEGRRAFRNRVSGLGGGRSKNLIAITAQINLFDSQLDLEAIINVVKINTQDMPPVALIVIDTLASAFGSGEENSARDAGIFTANVARLIDALDASVLLVHHTGKESERGARGSSALKASVDTEIEVKRGTQGEPNSIRATKQRDMAADAELGYELKVVELAIDEDGDPVTSCRVTYFPGSTSTPGSKLSGHQKTTMGAIEAYIVEAGVDNLTGLDHDPVRRTVPLKDAKQAAITAVGETGHDNPRRAVLDALKALAKKNLVEFDETELWIPVPGVKTL